MYPGYLKHKRISDELANFLGKPHGTMMTREEATRDINVYMLFNRLLNGRNIKYDYQLFDLMKIPGETLSISNFQKYLGQHFT
jgi:chromatin remodeling complex protein RSC6